MAEVTDAVRERFESYVERIPEAGCWIWMGSGKLNSAGYGTFSLDKKNCRAHRIAYQIYVGPVPAGLVLDHLCRTPSCVNPYHLEPVTQRENILRGVGATALNARKTHCTHGHELTPENTHIRNNGSRQCTECAMCRSIALKKWRAAVTQDARRYRLILRKQYEEFCAEETGEKMTFEQFSIGFNATIDALAGERQSEGEDKT